MARFNVFILSIRYLLQSLSDTSRRIYIFNCFFVLFIDRVHLVTVEYVNGMFIFVHISITVCVNLLLKYFRANLICSSTCLWKLLLVFILWCSVLSKIEDNIIFLERLFLYHFCNEKNKNFLLWFIKTLVE